MKRLNNLYGKVYDLANLHYADVTARKGKSNQPGVKEHLKNEDANILLLQQMLKNKSYRTSPYTRFTVYEPKEREVSRLPYFPDRICHHAIMNVLEPVFVAMFTKDTYSCIKGKGIHDAARNVEKALQDKEGTQYCLKLDVRKFYPSVDHAILKQLLRRKIKDRDMLWLLFEIIDSAAGLPIGNYLSMYFANFYLCGFDHWVKEIKKLQYYFRYADDIVILSDSKPALHQLLSEITQYLKAELNLTVKDNYQVFPIAARGLDFVGYVFYHTHTLLRKIIKKNFARAVRKGANAQTIAAYMGWAAHADTNHFLKKILPSPHEKIQRPGHSRYLQKLHRRQTKNRQDTKPGNSNTGL